MVPGNALVQVERLHPVGADRRQVVAVEVEDAGPRSVRRAVIVGAARLGPLAERLDPPDFERRARDRRENLADPRVDPPADRVIAVAQRVTALRREACIGAQMLEELAERAGKADPLLDLLHLA